MSEKVLYGHLDNPHDADIRRGASYLKLRPDVSWRWNRVRHEAHNDHNTASLQGQAHRVMPINGPELLSCTLDSLICLACPVTFGLWLVAKVELHLPVC